MCFYVNIRNCPEYAKKKPFILANYDNGQLWFFGAYEKENEAYRIASETNTIVIQNDITN